MADQQATKAREESDELGCLLAPTPSELNPDHNEPAQPEWLRAGIRLCPIREESGGRPSGGKPSARCSVQATCSPHASLAFAHARQGL